MPQVHGGHKGGQVFGQNIGGHAGDAGAEGGLLFRVQFPVADVRHRHRVPGGFQGQAQLFGGGDDLVVGGKGTAVQLDEEPVPVAFQTCRGGRGGGTQGLFLLHGAAGTLQRSTEIFRRQVQLDQIIHRTHTDAAAHIVKLLIAGEHDEGGQGGVLFPAAGGEGQAVHHRHADVRHHDVRVQFLDLFQGLAAVAGGTGQFKALGGPVDHALHADQNQGLVIHKQNVGHELPPLAESAGGRRTVTMVPLPGSERMERP